MDTLQKLRGKADAWERIGESHPSFRDAELVSILRTAADEIERLRNALEPFGDIDVEGAEDFSDDTKATVIFGRTTNYSLKLGYFLRARATLERWGLTKQATTNQQPITWLGRN